MSPDAPAPSKPAAGPNPPRLVDELAAVIGTANVLTEPADMGGRLTEDRGLYEGHALALLRPSSTEEVSKVVQLCRDAGVVIVPQGGNTGLVGGGVPYGGIILSTERLNTVFEVDRVNATMTVGAGCILANIQDTASEAEALFPLSLASEGSCQIGGNLATNAGGTAVLRYGNTRDLVLGLEVVLPDGRILSDLNRLRKNNMGYDLRNLFIGSEGTLGIITAAVLKLFPKPVQRATAMVSCTGPQTALALYDRLRTRNADTLSTFEYIDCFALQMSIKHAGCTDPFNMAHPAYCLVEMTSANPDEDLNQRLEAALSSAFEAEEISDAVIGASEAQKDALWRMREELSEAQKPEGASIKHDVAVPVSRVADFILTATQACLAYMPDLRPCPFGHFGDGNLHFNLTRPKNMKDAEFLAEYPTFNRIVHDIVHEMGGSISAEHGIGQVKRAELARYKDPVSLAVMQQIKATLDPDNLMNPGKLFQ